MNYRPDFLLWHEVFEAGTARCGGKGWNLARLHRYGFDVPRGGVLTVEGYTHVLNSFAISSAVRSLREARAEEALTPSVAAALDDLRTQIESAEWPSEFEPALVEFLYRSGCECASLAVRSSATAEDSLTASFAGIHRSFLNIQGAADIARAILGCYASLWTPQAFAYRRRLRFEEEEVTCAVVICAMVSRPGSAAPDSAGVAFTCDPSSGRRDLIVINSARGSGEAVVGGQVRPEQIIVRREKRGRLCLERRSDAGEPVLTPEQALRLARAAVRVQWALGDGQIPQDVEWAFEGDRLWILQARPVTSLPSYTFPALKDQPVIWSTVNIKEAVPGVVSTMSWSLIQDAIEVVLYAGFVAAGYEIPPGLEVVRRFAGRGYFDIAGIQWGLFDAMGVLPSQTAAALGGHQPQITVPPGNPFRGKHGRRRFVARLRLARRLWRIDHELEREIRRSFQESDRLIPEDLKSISSAELMQILQRTAAIFDGIGFLAGLADAGTGGGQEMLAAQLRRIAGDRGQALMIRLLAGFGNVTSAEQGYRIYDLAAAARQDAAARIWLRSMRPAREWPTLPPDSVFRKELKRFLDEFGHRTVVEADLINPRWKEDPGYILDQVRTILDTEPGAKPAEKARAQREKAEEEISRLTFWRRPLIRWLVRRLQLGMARREAAKSALGATALPTRQVLLEIGRRLVVAGNLDQGSDVFHLAIAEVEAYLMGEWIGHGARELAADRKEQRERWLASSPPDVIVGKGDMAVALDRRINPDTGSRTRWSGMGVAPGQAQGTCRIVRHPFDGDRLKPGEILVAPSSDPGWTPLFLRASGIVMETGGFLSHSAIVAREYGIPTVVNIPCLLEQVCDGATLRVDGDQGVVEVINDQENK